MRLERGAVLKKGGVRQRRGLESDMQGEWVASGRGADHQHRPEMEAADLPYGGTRLLGYLASRIPHFSRRKLRRFGFVKGSGE
jgi:hypothetical protein